MRSARLSHHADTETAAHTRMATAKAPITFIETRA
jgi:hypothetical protein